MKSVYRLFRRGKTYYAHDSRTGKQLSLRTSDRREARQLIAARIESANQSEFTLAIGKAYLGVTDSTLLDRTWGEAMEILAKRGCQSTQSRCKRASENRAFDALRGGAAAQG